LSHLRPAQGSRRWLHGRGEVSGEALDAPAVRLIVKKRCELAGVHGSFSAHSLRSGFMTEAGRNWGALAEAMAFSVHRDVRTALGSGVGCKHPMRPAYLV
jgi:hypothetical protein